MDHTWRRRLLAAPLSLVLVSSCLAVTAAPAAAARPSPARGLLARVLALAGPAQAPVTGPLVDLPCANPANHGLVGRVLGAVRLTAGGPLGCLGQAVGASGEHGPLLMPGPTGLSPAQIQSAYKLTGLNAAGRTVAVVDAYDDPHAASDLATFRQTYGLPPCGSGCFTKEGEHGPASPLPAGDPGWGTEISLDLDAISSACPTCHILLVEANSTNTPDFDAAEDTAAATPGVVAISNSYGGSEATTDTTDDAHFHHPGIAITASSGDSGYGTEWPAASPYVTAVGGTTLTAASNPRGWSETAWSGSGSGCSQYEPKPTWQTDPGCAKRTVADVAADADPSSGLAIYDTYNTCGSNGLCDLLIELGLVQGLDGWAQVGGTSLSSPIVASVYALAGNTSTVTGANLPYAHASSLFDVTSGSNGTCTPTYLCTAGAGYDGPTGLGSPDGTGAF